jgi:molybdate transport system regulatory protein
MARTRTGPAIAPRQKLWLTWGSDFLMGPNYLRFLRAVEETGTIREAGEAVGWSYRTCLNRVRRMEEVLGEAVLLTTRGGASGGGARVSPRVLRLADVYERWRDEVLAYSERSFRRAMRERDRR